MSDEEKTTIFKRLASVMREIKAIGKDQKNQQQGWSFRSIDQIYSTIHPLFAKHGIVTIPKVISMETGERKTRSGGVQFWVCLTIDYVFTAEDGSSVECRVMGEAADMGDKAIGKAMSYAQKYAILQTFCIPVEEDPKDRDPDHSVNETTIQTTNRQSSSHSSNPAMYVFKEGKLKGQRISSIHTATLRDGLQKRKAQNPNKPLTEDQKAVEKYLNSLKEDIPI